MDSPGTSAELGSVFLAARHTTVSESSVTAPATVLLIDDDPAIINSVVASLGEAGHQALVAMDSSEARTLVQRRSVTLVLFSWRFIAQLGGPDFLRELRQRSPLRSLPMIVFSDDHDELMEASQHGVQDYLPNPQRGDDLVHLVEEYTG
ncbi:MAG TPA: response regulator [Pseudomonadota bacterium]|nr:response regulator [Pseudomonadota bacterium]